MKNFLLIILLTSCYTAKLQEKQLQDSLAKDKNNKAKLVISNKIKQVASNIVASTKKQSEDIAKKSLELAKNSKKENIEDIKSIKENLVTVKKTQALIEKYKGDLSKKAQAELNKELEISKAKQKQLENRLEAKQDKKEALEKDEKVLQSKAKKIGAGLNALSVLSGKASTNNKIDLENAKKEAVKLSKKSAEVEIEEKTLDKKATVSVEESNFLENLLSFLKWIILFVIIGYSIYFFKNKD